MKKTIFFLTVLLSSLSSLPAFEEIACSMKPVNREQIHPLRIEATAISSNWSGYVAAPTLSGAASANHTVSHVAGTWTVPLLAATPNTTYCAIWVGIDGYRSGSVEQIGTSHNWVNGAQQNYAWFEMYPQGSYEIVGFPVNHGDVIGARVDYQGNNVFLLEITNYTKNVSTTIPTSYTKSSTALRSSAEWIVEAPYSGQILPLSDFKTVTLSNCSTVINGVNGAINHGTWANNEIIMETSRGVVEAQTSSLLTNGSSFQVTWKSQ